MRYGFSVRTALSEGLYKKFARRKTSRILAGNR